MPQKTIWHEDSTVRLIDQTLLPGELKVIPIRTVNEMWEAIQQLKVRGAPAIGIAAAYGVYIAAQEAAESGGDALAAAREGCDYLATSRPTAVNLFWAVDRMRGVVGQNSNLSGSELAARLLLEAENIRSEDDEACMAIGRHAAQLLKSGSRVFTHCNAGGLATASYGTALAPIYWAVQQEGKKIEVVAGETRPLLQGARLTAWELMQANIPVTLICDSMAASVMQSGRVDCVIVGADRIATNGDFANKIGTYGLAILAREHKLPFYVAAPLSTIDRAIESGADIPIELRNPAEITSLSGYVMAPDGVEVYNPAFDVTPFKYVTAFVTERGLINPPFLEGIRQTFETEK